MGDFFQISNGWWILHEFGICHRFDLCVLFVEWWYRWEVFVSTIHGSVCNVFFHKCWKLWQVHLSRCFFVVNFSLPWNQHTNIGYFWEICYDLVTAEVYVFSGAMFIILFVSLCYHHRAFFKIFQHSLHTFDRSDEARNDEILLFQLIRFHVTIKEWELPKKESFSKHLHTNSFNWKYLAYFYSPPIPSVFSFWFNWSHRCSCCQFPCFTWIW